MRKPMIAGNWKLNKTIVETVEFIEEFIALDLDDGVEVVLAPVFPSLAAAALVLGDNTVGLAAQNMHWAESGAYTGEVSAEMLRDSGCSHVILGHSERRQYFGETDEGVAKKGVRALAAGLTPILCVGETLEEREDGSAFSVVEKQVKGALADIGAGLFASIVLAYEPVWAIGTGKTATAAQAQEMHAHIRKVLEELGGQEAEKTRILYGGSVKPENIAEIMDGPDVDGALVGGASLDAKTFASIVNFRV